MAGIQAVLTSYNGTFVISWSQSEVDGLTGAPVAALEVGATWRWAGRAVRVDGPDDIIPLGQASGEAELHARAAQAVRRIVSASVPRVSTQQRLDFEDPLMNRSFQITDGRSRFTATMIDAPELARPLIMFVGELPPVDRDLWITQVSESEGHINRVTETPTGVICFTKGTLLRTPDGHRRVEDLAEGDKIDTKDGGAQEIVWIGKRDMSGARLHAMPELRPIRIRTGALGEDVPIGDLLVSPRHRVLLKGDSARALFNTPEVLVAAEDLVNDQTITRDHASRSVSYVHLLLPRHHVVWANGVETESFHPASTAFETIETQQRDRLSDIIPGIEVDPHAYGASARRELTRSEAAVLTHDSPLRH